MYCYTFRGMQVWFNAKTSVVDHYLFYGGHDAVVRWLERCCGVRTNGGLVAV